MSRVVFISVLAVSTALTTFANAAISLKQLAELTPTDRVNQDWFGTSIAIDKDTVVVGDFDANIEQYGAAYVYVKPASGWQNMTQVAKLTSSDNGVGFGTSVAISGNVIVIGAANTSNFNGPQATPGAVYVFVKPAGGWKDMTETAKLVASDGVAGDAFGNSVSINGGTIAVGAFFVNNFSGRAYVFTRTGSTWKQAAELTASDSSGFLDYLGCSVAISGNTVVAGSFGHNNFAGAAYVYVEPVTGWVNMTETAELSVSNGRGGDNLGFSVGTNGTTIVAGAPGAANGDGSAYVYVEPPNGWGSTSNFTAQLAAPDATQGDSFGQAVGMSGSGGVVIVGAPGQTVGADVEQGAAYVYVRPKSGWLTTKRASSELTASDGAAFDSMGVSVGASGSTFVIGAPKSTAPGEAYVFGP